jgi:hypothetical protein
VNVTEGQVLLFEVEGRRFGAYVAEVRRVAPPADLASERRTVLGTAAEGGRGLVIELDGNERAVAVDRILGVRPGTRILAAPPIVAACGGGTVRGFVELENELLPLVDLRVVIARASGGGESDGD